VLTVVSEADALDGPWYDNVRLFVAENAGLANSLTLAGIPRERVRVIHPGVNLSNFTVAASPPPTPFRILFASWPEDPRELEGRGVLALVALARRCPDVEVVLLRRQWGTFAETTAALAALNLPSNVRIEDLGSRTMSDMYAGVHACAALFAPGYGKSSPNSLIESLACGRPVLVTANCGIAESVTDAAAGLCVEPDVDDLAAAVGVLRQRWPEASVRARTLAEQAFSEEAFVAGYEAVYEVVRNGAVMPNLSLKHSGRPFPHDRSVPDSK